MVSSKVPREFVMEIMQLRVYEILRLLLSQH